MTRRFPAIFAMRRPLLVCALTSCSLVSCSDSRAFAVDGAGRTARLIDEASPRALAVLSSTALAALDSQIVNSLLEQVPPESRERERTILVPSPGTVAIIASTPATEYEPLLNALANVRAERARRFQGAAVERRAQRVRVILSPSIDRDAATVAVVIKRPTDPAAPLVLVLRASDAGPRELAMGLRMAARIASDTLVGSRERRVRFRRDPAYDSPATSSFSRAAGILEMLSESPERDLVGFGRVRMLDVYTSLEDGR